ncbi:hypothetical protein ABB37_05608 [Leptomonas pyrrhocoris]|uniref:Uncharacterized protein n=1 Tax=Leptomonas pyrrhocoris TaxID=157538 RepID=A0A0M9FZC8_LEPPY|nr:hypothetical protein ABB37_05608 [Leptomonas pyrrhocoris]KPA79083.1 hypothetical protein ABB37_05608 [Leptomonas pyrrhocoris]|eukprot:XP_015657522.1 hypothetical protein ABB37_05608 [Leptomonas pyrrhocoris]
MWKNSLVDITRRAGRKTALPQLQKTVKTVLADGRVSQASALSSAHPIFSPASEALHVSQSDYQHQLKSSILQSSLENDKPLLRTADHSDALLRQTEHLPFSYAQEAFCALMKAGEVQLALQLVSFWQQGDRITSVRLSRRKVTKELRKTIQVLEKLKDSTTLKALINILSDSLKEQVFAQKMSLHAVALTHSRSGSPRVQYKLFAPLGAVATSDILVCAVEAACRLGKKEGMSAFEKILLADQCASSTISEVLPSGTPRLPFPLYRQIETLRVEENLDDRFIHQVCPDIASKLVHPSHYRIIDILSLSIDEAKYIDSNWKIQEILSASSVSSDAPSNAWCRVARRVLPQSPSLQSVEEKQLLISLISHKTQRAEVLQDQTWMNLRSRVIKLLKNSKQPVRRFTAAALLNCKHLVTSLKISPVEIGSVYAQSFYSKGRVDPALCAFCDFAVRRLCRNGRYRDAARLAWNHLSVECPATKSLFHASSTAVDFAVLSMSRAMRDEVAKGNAQNWMGYRSLALLRLAAVSGNSVTVLHCVPICVNAMNCGVPFAAIKQALSCVFSSDDAQRKWAVNLVRLCSQNEIVPAQLLPTRRGVSSDFRKLLTSVCGAKANLNDGLLVHSPSRRRQIALWETVTDPEVNPRLNALTLATFLSEDVRSDILNCSFLLHSPKSALGDDFARSPAPTVDDIWSWEVAASIASNCTTPESYRSFLKCLKQRKPKLPVGCSTDLDYFSAVMSSELEGHDLANVKTMVTEK